jgi:flagellar basal-body rod protein FlgB
MVSKIDNAFAFQQQALGLRAQRQQLLAANIANADTPNYKARDFDFSAVLKDTLAGRSGGNLAMTTTASGHQQASSDFGSVRLMYRGETQSSVDGNTVNMDVERAQFAENAIQYEAGITFISGQLKTLMSAIQSQ